MRDIALDAAHTLNVQAVELRTGVTAETLRTWERRYGWPRPRRSPNGYRAYSEDDVALILAVKRELDAGVATATAWQRVLAARQRRPRVEAPRAPEHLGAELLAALLAFDQDTARALIAEAHALYPLERVLLGIIQPTLVEVGSRWHAGEVTVAQEHFASTLLRDSLVTISNFYRPGPEAGTIMVGAAPEELHEIGALMLAVSLRRNRHNVIYLGQNIGLERLDASLQQVRPRMLVLSAARLETARHLARVAPLIARMRPPRPLFAFGGRAFTTHPELAERIAGTFIPGDAVAAVARIEELLAGASRP